MAPKESQVDVVHDLAPATILVTPYSTGCLVGKEIQERGYKIICLWSAGFSETMKTHVPSAAKGLRYELVLEEQETLEMTTDLVRKEAARAGLDIVACICGGEAGVDLADALSEYMGFVTNGTDVPNRRDKKVQQELIREAGIRAIRQAAGSKVEEVEEFLQTEKYPLIVKPTDSAGSDGVKLCHSYEEAREHFITLTTTHQRVNGGGACEEVLCQEFLKGTEYVVDHVSRDGIHKTVMMWVYDKRAVNGASFVYFGDVPLDSESEEAKQLIPYTRKVLDALGVKNGPSHGEVIMTEDGPCLVEMNCRAHGGDGIWVPLCKGLTSGYCQVDVSVDAYFDKEKFMALPDKPPSPFHAAGQCVDLVNFKGGTVKSTPGYDVIRLLPSFVCMNSHIKKGTVVSPTIDMATEAGNLIVMNKDAKILARDIELIRQMESKCLLFDLESEEDKHFQMLKPSHRSSSLVKGVCSTIHEEGEGFTMLSWHQRSTSFAGQRHRRMYSGNTPAMFSQSKHL